MNGRATVRNVLMVLVCLLAVAMAWEMFKGSRSFTRSTVPIRDDGAFVHWATLSPDGSNIMLLRATEDVRADDKITTTVELRSVASSALIKSASFPSTSGATAWFNPANYVTFCDDGRLLLAYLSHGVFAVVDANTLEATRVIDLGDPARSAGSSGSSIAVDAVCAADASTAVFEIFGGATGGEGRGMLKIFDLQTGQQTGEIDSDADPGNMFYAGISASGRRAFVAVEGNAYDGVQPFSLTVFDLQARAVLQHIHAQSRPNGAAFAFVGENAIAAASVTDRRALPRIELLDVQRGSVVRTFSDSRSGAQAIAGASADGRVLMAYTGSEEAKPSALGDLLHIHSARFTLWSTETGAVLGRSPDLEVKNISAQPLDILSVGPKKSWRPYLQMDQTGNAVLTGYPSWNVPFDVYTLRTTR